MNWNYRLISTPFGDSEWLAIHEVYYSKKGKPKGWTEEPITIGGETYEEVISEMTRVLADISAQRILYIKNDKLVENPND